MRGLLLYLLLSGGGWLICGAVVLIVAGMDLGGRLRGDRARRIGGFLVLLALGVAPLTGTPVPLWAAVALGAPVLAYAVAGPGRIRWLAAGAALAAAGAVAGEVPWLAAGGPPPSKITVIGDSLSSGGFAESAAWPEILAREYRVPVSSLARPSDTTASAARDQLPMLRGDEAVVVAVGGNDLLGGTPPGAFARDLEQIVRGARAAGAEEIWMLELPIPPGKWAYGRAQRRIAREHGVRVIPKRVLLRVLTRADLTDDGLHPTSAGHERLARDIARVMGLRRS